MTAREAPHVAVLLLNWNGWRDTIECLESLFRLDYPSFTVVLCDNESTDGSPERIRSWAAGTEVHELKAPRPLRRLVHPPVPKPIRLLECTRREAEERDLGPIPSGSVLLIHNGANLGFAGGNNVGLRLLLRRTDTKYVWVLNNDILVAPDSLQKLVETAESTPKVGGIGGTLMEYDQPDTIQSVAGGRFTPWQGMSVPLRDRAARDGAVPRIDYVSGGCMLSPIEAIRAVGLIDERYFMYGEDVDFSVRIRAAGFTLGMARDALVWHKGGGAVGHRSAHHDYYILRNSLYLAWQYHPRAFPIAAAYIAYRCIVPKLVRGQWQRLRTLHRAYGDFRRGIVGPAPVLTEGADG